MPIKPLNFIHWNCNSLYNKQNDFLYFIDLFKPDIISLNETKLSRDRFDSEIYIKNLQNYSFIHRHWDEYDHLNLELISVNIKFNDKVFLIITYYNPPNLSINKELFEAISNNSYILLGDLNAKSEIIRIIRRLQNG